MWFCLVNKYLQNTSVKVSWWSSLAKPKNIDLEGFHETQEQLKLIRHTKMQIRLPNCKGPKCASDVTKWEV